MKKTIEFYRGVPDNEGWYLVVGEKGGIVSAYFYEGVFWFLNVLNPMADAGTPGRGLSTYMMKITNVECWVKSL